MIRSKILKFCKWSLLYRTKRFSIDVGPIDMAYDYYEPPNKTSDMSVLIMHGFFGSKNNFKTVSRNLAKKLGMQIFALDTRNHGESPHTHEHTTFQVGEDMAHFVTMHELGKVHMIGHSMGGRAVAYYTLRYPDFVDKPIIVDVSPFSTPVDIDGMSKILEAMKEVHMIPKDYSLSKGRTAMKGRLLEATRGKRASTIEFIMMNLRKEPSGEFYWTLNIDTLQNGLYDFEEFGTIIANFPPYEGEALFICGKRSPFLTMEEWPQIKKIFPNAKIVWLDTGHLVHIEEPQKFADLVVDFIQEK